MRGSLLLATLVFVSQTALVPRAHAAFVRPSEKENVDLLLVLAVDVSSSIGDPDPNTKVYELTLQKKGIANALRDPEVARVLEQCNGGGIGLTYVEWSGAGEGGGRQVHQVFKWAKIRNATDLTTFANRVENRAGRSFNDSTDIRSALEESARYIEDAPYASDRKIIDISSDGRQNVRSLDIRVKYGLDAPEDLLDSDLVKMRDQVVDKGILINALVILNDSQAHTAEKPLDRYFEKNVIGGPGSFVVPVQDFNDYSAGLKFQLLRELNNCMG